MDSYKSRLKTKYEDQVRKILMEEFGEKNIHALPRITKVIVNTGIGEAAKNKEAMAAIERDLALITSQKPSLRLARVSVASFSVRKGMPVGLKVTLRGEGMYDFLDKIFSVVLPRLRDFRGVPISSFDKEGNYTLGIIEHTVFPEIDLTKSPKPFGLEITIVTSTKDPVKSKRLMELLGMPFVKEG